MTIEIVPKYDRFAIDRDVQSAERGNVPLSDQIRSLRRFLDITGEEFGAVIGISKSAVSKVEKGGRTLNHHQLQALVTCFGIDPRYFFGSIENPRDAQIAHSKGSVDIDGLAREIRDLCKKVNPGGMSQIAHDIAINGDLRELVELVHNLDCHVIRELRGVVYGYLHADESAVRHARRNQPGLDAGTADLVDCPLADSDGHEKVPRSVECGSIAR